MNRVSRPSFLFILSTLALLQDNHAACGMNLPVKAHRKQFVHENRNAGKIAGVIMEADIAAGNHVRGKMVEVARDARIIVETVDYEQCDRLLPAKPTDAAWTILTTSGSPAP